VAKAIDSGAESVKVAADDLFASTKDGFGKVTDLAGSAFGQLGGLLGALARDFPGVGQALGAVQTGMTILGGFGFKAGGVIKAATGKVLAPKGGGVRMRSGLLKGEGTPTSDSIPGIVLDQAGKPKSGILVSTEESVLNAKATQALGEPFVNWVNMNAHKFAAGGVILPSSPPLANALSSVSRSGARAAPASAAAGVRESFEAMRGMQQQSAQPQSMRLEVSDQALHRTLRDYLEDYFRDVVATR
jgi:hypothetical protein